MNIDQLQIDSLVANPTESLNVEVKRWIDPGIVEGQAKIIRAVFALRNRNGGFLIVGFDDNGAPNIANQPTDPRASFHIDTIQGLVSKYAQEFFEVGVGFSTREGIEYPVIVVPAGVQTPVAAKNNLPESASRLVQRGDVYFRTLAANGTPSTSPAKPEDWRDIVGICFDNREADVGRFLRRQMAGQDPTTLASVLWGIADSAPIVPQDRLWKNEPGGCLTMSEAQFRKALSRVGLADNETVRKMAASLTWEIALVVDPEWEARVPDETSSERYWAATLITQDGQIWLDSRSFSEESKRPKIHDGAWEVIIASTVEDWSGHLEFMRLDPRGRFYLRRALQDDQAPQKVAPGTALDPIVVIIRVAEAIAVGIAITNALIGGKGEPRRLGFAFRWRGLAKRILKTWANPSVLMIGEPRAHDNEVSTYVELLSDTPINAIAPAVQTATRDLFALFDGEIIPPHVIEYWSNRLVERRLM